MTLSLCTFCDHDGGDDQKKDMYDILESLLPAEYHHVLCRLEPIDESNSKHFLRLKLTTVDEVQQWLTAFKRSSCITWRKSKTYPDAGRYNKYRVDLRCQHKTRYTPKSVTPGKVTKNTDCPANMYLVLKRSMANSRSQDQHILNGLLFSVKLRNEHNHHQSACTGALRRRDVSEETIAKLRDLFEYGHSPSSALSSLKSDLREEHGDQYVYASADRSLCPDLQFCYRLYYKTFKKTYGASSPEEMRSDLEKRLQTYNEGKCDTCVKVEHIDDGRTVVAISTPLMKRVHARARQSGEVIFIESSDYCDRQNSRIYVLLTHSLAGGLPLGVLITTSESQETITAGVRLLQSIQPEGAFFGRGSRGPLVAVTEDCETVRQAIREVYPETTAVLSTSHLLRDTWCWLWDAHNRIAKQDRTYLLAVFKDLVRAGSTSELETRYQATGEDPTVRKYRGYEEHLSAVFQRRQEWALYLIGDDETREFVEAAIGTVRDRFLHWLKAYNVVHLVDFIATKTELYYARRLLDIANNRAVDQQPRSFVSDEIIDCNSIEKENEVTYSVPSTLTGHLYHVDVDIGICTCRLGNAGGPCEHQQAVTSTFNIATASRGVQSTSPELRMLYYTIATGIEDITESEVILPQDDTAPPNNTAASAPSAASAVPDTPIQGHDPPDPPSHLDPPDHLVGSDGTAQSVHDQALQDKLRGMFDALSGKLREDGDIYRLPMKSFVSNFEKITTDGALISALFTFDKYSTYSTTRQIAHKFRRVPSRDGVTASTSPRRKFPRAGQQAKRGRVGRPPRGRIGPGTVVDASLQEKHVEETSVNAQIVEMCQAQGITVEYM